MMNMKMMKKQNDELKDDFWSSFNAYWTVNGNKIKVEIRRNHLRRFYQFHHTDHHDYHPPPPLYHPLT